MSAVNLISGVKDFGASPRDYLQPGVAPQHPAPGAYAPSSASPATRPLTVEGQQRPGCLPAGFGMDSLLTVEEFAVWRRRSVATVRRQLPVMPGVIGHGRKGKVIHPRTFLERSLKAGN